jgi:trimethyllysine dioxygenase
VPDPPFHDLESNRGTDVFLTSQQRCFGFSFVAGCPPTPSATEALLNRIAFIRPTQYGSFWDFTSSANPTDTAYTTLALPVHNDTTYFTDPCGLQMFHLLSHTDGSGGASTLVDGFAAATHLYKANPDFYNVLSTSKIISHASGNKKVGSIDNSTLCDGFPVFQHTKPSSAHGKLSSKLSPGNLTQVRWNNDDRASMTRWEDRKTMELWYAAARKWTEILQMPEFVIRVQLEPGRPLIFDNWRMLHGRTAFTGKRRVCGGYIGMDDFMARWRMLDQRGEGERVPKLMSQRGPASFEDDKSS